MTIAPLIYTVGGGGCKNCGSSLSTPTSSMTKSLVVTCPDVSVSTQPPPTEAGIGGLLLLGLAAGAIYFMTRR